MYTIVTYQNDVSPHALRFRPEEGVRNERREAHRDDEQGEQYDLEDELDRLVGYVVLFENHAHHRHDHAVENHVYGNVQYSERSEI